MSETSSTNVMEQIVSLCKKRGFIYPASDIYGGINGFWDYGPLGVLLKNNIRDWWWRVMVECPPIGPDGHPVEMVGIDTAIIQNPKTWEASGHVGGFSDPMVDDKDTQGRYRADHLYGLLPSLRPSIVQEVFAVTGEPPAPPIPVATCIASTAGEALSIFESEKKTQKLFGIRDLSQSATHEDGTPVVSANVKGIEGQFSIVCLFSNFFKGKFDRIPSPVSGKVGALTEPRQFNLMLSSEIGAVNPVKAYLRPETAQGIFLNFKNIIDTTRVRIPFGVAQIGKSFRNEVTPRNFIFRSREFEQMEMEWFCHPDDARKWYDFWKHERMNWWRSLGVAESNLRFRDHASDELSHYSKMTVDIEYKYPFTAPEYGELEGIAHRGCFDLTQHQTHSGQKLDYFDQELQLKLKAEGKSDEEIRAASRYIPNVIEPASGLTRAVLVLLCEAFTPDEARPSKMYLKFDPKFAPIKCGIFPLVNKDGMPELAEKIYLDLRTKYRCEYDAKQSIGKRYARMDEIGAPYCITVDGQTREDNTVTVRERDAMTQTRVSLDQLGPMLSEKFSL